MHWFLRFLQGEHSSIRREYRLAAFQKSARHVTIVIDASPWGLGGAIYVDHQLCEFFADQVSADDLRILKIQEGNAESQQVLECLCVLVAMKLWFSHWSHDRATFRARGDNITMLVMVSELKGRSPAVNLITREVALLVARAAFKPIGAEHTPGVANRVTDILSRLTQPGKSSSLPREVLSAKRIHPPRRNDGYYIALRGPKA